MNEKEKWLDWWLGIAYYEIKYEIMTLEIAIEQIIVCVVDHLFLFDNNIT